jgi:hypothetical protein
MNKTQLTAALTAKGIAFDPSLSNKALEALLKTAPTDPVQAQSQSEAKAEIASAMPPPAAPEAPTDLSDIEVGDPQVLRPVELPLVIKPKSGAWDNDAQAKYARYLNAYAYKNPKKWEKKKQALLKRLVQIGTDPELLSQFRGENPTQASSVAYKNHAAPAGAGDN